ncbi:MAG TPA: hypothetical protein VGB73_01275 [Pyrinomonadaceae bacterium]|jgi:hypothetical protein
MKILARICQKSVFAAVLTLVLTCPAWAGEIPQPLPPPPAPIVNQTPSDSSDPVGADGQTNGTTTPETQIATVESLAEALLTLLQNSFSLL